ncbi:hypothetical protein V6U90_23195 [Micromonospora sp. CPCC 206060]
MTDEIQVCLDCRHDSGSTEDIVKATLTGQEVREGVDCGWISPGRMTNGEGNPVGTVARQLRRTGQCDQATARTESVVQTSCHVIARLPSPRLQVVKLALALVHHVREGPK